MIKTHINLVEYNNSIFLKNKDLIDLGCEFTYDYSTLYNEREDDEDSKYYTHCLEMIIEITPFFDYNSSILSIFKKQSIDGLNIIYKYKPSLFYENSELIDIGFEFIYENTNSDFIDWLIEKKVVFSSNTLYRAISFKNYSLATKLIDMFINDNKIIIKSIQKDLNENDYNTDFTNYVINKPNISRYVIDWYIYYVIDHWSNETLVESIYNIKIEDTNSLSRYALYSITKNKPKIMDWLKKYNAFDHIPTNEWFDIFIYLIRKRKIDPIKWFFINKYKINFTTLEFQEIIQKSNQYLKNKQFNCVVYFLYKICKYTKNDPFVQQVLKKISIPITSK